MADSKDNKTEHDAGRRPSASEEVQEALDALRQNPEAIKQGNMQTGPTLIPIDEHELTEDDLRFLKQQWEKHEAAKDALFKSIVDGTYEPEEPAQELPEQEGEVDPELGFRIQEELNQEELNKQLEILEKQERKLMEELEYPPPAPESLSPPEEKKTPGKQELKKEKEETPIKTEVPLAREFREKTGLLYKPPEKIDSLLREISKGDPISYKIMVNVLGSESGFKNVKSPTGVSGIAQMTNSTLYETLYNIQDLLPEKARQIVKDNIVNERTVKNGKVKYVADIKQGGNRTAVHALKSDPVVALIAAREHMRKATNDGKKFFRDVEIGHGKISWIKRSYPLLGKPLPTERLEALRKEMTRPITAADVKVFYLCGSSGGAKILAALGEPSARDERARDYTDPHVVRSNPWVFHDHDRPRSIVDLYHFAEFSVRKDPLPKGKELPTQKEEKLFRKVVSDRISDLKKIKDKNGAPVHEDDIKTLEKELKRPMTSVDAKIFDVAGGLDGAKILAALALPGAEERLAKDFVHHDRLKANLDYFYTPRNVLEFYQYIIDRVGTEPLPENLERPAHLNTSFNHYPASNPQPGTGSS